MVELSEKEEIDSRPGDRRGMKLGTRKRIREEPASRRERGGVGNEAARRGGHGGSLYSAAMGKGKGKRGEEG
jgi:hypothetical protein